MSLTDIEKIVGLLDNSPIREHLNKNKDKITLFEDERKILEKIGDIISTNINNLENPLKAVVLGEVKAGKSTLINALIQKEVAYTNVVEATASIIEIKYSEDENIFIHYNNDEKLKVNSLKELDKLMDENRTNQAFFEDIKKVSINTNTERLREIAIVDTPGLNTITTENAQRTDEYIKNADVILWVLNAHNLGQSDVIDKIENVVEYGKPIIGIVNRIDEIDGDEDEVLEYIEDEMGYIFNEVFTTSAKSAWDGFLQKDVEKLESSNINNLYEFIINNIEKKSEEFQSESFKSSIISQLNKDLYVHNNVNIKLDTMLEKIEVDLDDLKKINYNIKNIVQNKMNDWIDMEFFKEEKDILSACKNKDEYNKYLNEFRNEEYIKKIIDAQYKKIGNYIVEEWKHHTDKFIQKKTENINFSINIDGFEGSNQVQLCSGDEIVDGAKKGGITASAVGVSLAGYAAWLGPAAAQITMVSAVGAFLPPLLIAGAAGGAVWNYLQNDKNKINQYSQVEALVKGLKNNLKDNIFNYIIEKLNNSSDYYYEYATSIICDILSQCNTSKEEIENMNSELKKYIECIKIELMDLK